MTSTSQPTFAMVCMNNVNRSTAAHESLSAAGLRVCSYGAGKMVAFPGKSRTDARTFDFLTAYSDMHDTLKNENAALYSNNGVLQILKRNMALKTAPERWQSLNHQQLLNINIVICLDHAMFLTVLEDIKWRIQQGLKFKQLHIICLDIVDTPEEASLGGICVLELCRLLNVQTTKLTEEFVKKTVEQFEKDNNQKLLYLGLHTEP
ncbi:rna polymerase ii subunit a c-terminal domain [Plasmopara halstedii]|uniref:RNA polymerase II subunit A C-terminal domain phosphatase SSU72 n=1 Tax=Plasmopara halstedii TaxID=4781 RepID=A0A0P1AG91_PLAHL|nr:rna polymerase ii subunit a c-terminal domain [Plasmopara halstedii]CEG40116.1 rna polymerase ii subunit a c-terminal domain [Plasmopara halstedii]|eukprot:XP_024576485.1 rna polymerase ii subunit a c-terminal domain [Plasmopara halstedii]